MNEANKAVVRRFVEEFQAAGRTEVGEALLAADFRNHSPDSAATDDRAGVLAQFAMMRTGLPDLRVRIHDMVAEGDRVVTHKTFSGTHRGELVGMPPSGRRLEIEVIDILRLRDGQIVDHWNVVDRLSMMRQLGGLTLARFALRRLVGRLRSLDGSR